MTEQEDLIQLQGISDGIKPDLDTDRWHTCYYKETANNDRDEEYYFPCSKDRECCGRECCVPGTVTVTGEFPTWAIITLAVIAFLLLLLLICCIVYCCWKYCCKKKQPPTPPPDKRPPQLVVQKTPQPHPPPPKVEMYKRTPVISGGTLRRTPDNLFDITGTNTATTPGSYNSSSATYSYNYGPSTATRPKNLHSYQPVGSVSPGHRGARRVNPYRIEHSTASDSSPGGDEPRPNDPLITGRDKAVIRNGVERYSLSMTTPTSNTASERERSFEPSPMEVTFESAPKPIRVQHHEQVEITREKRPLLSRVDIPREQTARMEYLRSERV